MAFDSLFWARTNRAVLKCLSGRVVRVLFPSLTAQAAGNRAPAWKPCGNGISVTWSAGVYDSDCGYASLPINVWTEPEIEYYKAEVSFRHTLPTDSLHHWLYFHLLGIPIHKNQVFILGSSNCGLKWCCHYRADTLRTPCQLVDKKRETRNSIQLFYCKKYQQHFSLFISVLSIKNIHSTRWVNMPWKNACFWQAFRTWCDIFFSLFFYSLFLWPIHMSIYSEDYSPPYWLQWWIQRKFWAQP